MDRREWVTIVAFVAAVYGVSFISPEAAMMLAGIVAIAAFVRGDVTRRVLGN